MPRTKQKRSKRKADQHAHPRGVRPFWSGTISFGLVSVPVDLFPATRGSKTGLRMLDADGTPLSRRYYCPEDNVDVHPEHILRGYEVDEGEYVIVRDEELESLQPRQSRDIDLRRFVPRGDIPSILFDRAYFLTPAGESTKAYRLLADVMERTSRAGIATFVMRGKEYLVAILAEGGILQAETMRFADELRDAEDVGLPPKPRVDKRQATKFRKAIAGLSAKQIEPDDMVDEYSDKLRSLVARKQKQGKDVVETAEYEEPEADDAGAPVDLLQAIRLSLQGKGGGGNGKSGSRSRRSSKNGTPRHAADKLESQTKEELYQRAQRLDIAGRSSMSKQQLIRALRDGK